MLGLWPSARPGGHFLEKRKVVTTAFDELADAYFTYAVHQQRKRAWPRDQTGIRALKTYFEGKRLTEVAPATIE